MLNLEKPFQVARSSNIVLLVAEKDLTKLESLSTMAQTYHNGNYSLVQPLQVMLKFLYGVADIDPPQPWSVQNG